MVAVGRHSEIKCKIPVVNLTMTSGLYNSHTEGRTNFLGHLEETTSDTHGQISHRVPKVSTGFARSGFFQSRYVGFCCIKPSIFRSSCWTEYFFLSSPRFYSLPRKRIGGFNGYANQFATGRIVGKRSCATC